MTLSTRALAATCGLIWAGCLLVVGLLNLLSASYGVGFLTLMSSLYPGFHASRTPMDVLIGTSDALIDGAIGGFVVAWLYNWLADRVNASPSIADPHTDVSSQPRTE